MQIVAPKRDELAGLGPNDLAISFGGMPVGAFSAGVRPRSDGQYSYTPFRSAGHYEMGLQRRAGLKPRCYYELDGVRVLFTVRGCPPPGILDVHDFVEEPASLPPPTVEKLLLDHDGGPTGP